MEKKNMIDRRLTHGAALLNKKCQRIAGRAGVIAAVLVFIAGYLYGISAFGIIPGIAFGWLPCGAAAWLTAMVVAALGTPVLRYVITAWRQLSLLACFPDSA